MRITVTGPSGGRPAAPVAARIPLDRLDDRMMGLFEEKTHRPVPAQVDSRGRLCWLEASLEEGEVRRYRLDMRGFLGDAERVIVREEDESTAAILQRGRVIARYRGSSAARRPFLSPILSPAGHGVTVDMGDVPASACKSPHHHSCWSGWGDVNGVDHWTDSPSAGRQVHRRFTLSVSGAVFGRVSALIDWEDPQGERQFAEQRVYTVYAQAEGYRVIDVISRFMFAAGPVTFGDTVHGGICALCVAEALTPGGGGLIRNAVGEQGEEDCWGAAAAWCDVTGQIADRFVGVTVFDYPGNLRFPTFWNVRSDGLLAANPFGLGGFLKDRSLDGSRTFEAGSVAMFRYRLLIHDTNPTAEEIERHSACFTRSLEIVVE